MEISVQRALTELKGLDSRIRKATSARYVGRKKKSADAVYNTNLGVDKFNADVEANYQSVTDLIARRNKMKAAVVLSNATTKVVIGDVEMTVAEAIERKESICYDKNLLRELKRQYESVITNVATENATVERDIKENIALLVSKDKTVDIAKEIQAITDSTKAQREWEVIDPLDLKTKIETLEERIQTFEEEVDYVLSTSNVQTMIEIE